jgi:Flp pilus assembly protein TadG
MLTVFLMVFLLGMIAFALDIGYVLLAKTQLQTAADSAALVAAGTMGNTDINPVTEAEKFANWNKVGNQNVIIKDQDVVYGTWDVGSRVFTPSQEAGISNAVKVTARADNTTSGSIPLFFGPVLGVNSVNTKASAVAVANPRDICFVVDLSSSMNDDTDPANETTINNKYANVGTGMMQKFYTDMGFGAYPGTQQSIGEPLGATSLSTLASTSNSPLRYSQKSYVLSHYSYTVPPAYLIYVTGDGSGKTADTSATAKVKAYSWVIDEQMGGKSGSASIPGIMKNAQPPLNTSGECYTYWKAFIDYLGTNKKLGYLEYVKKFEPCGRDKAPFSGTSSLLSPMSVDSPYYVHHSESTDAGTYEFPAAEMPTHSARRAIIGAIKVIKDRNDSVNDSTQQDWVSIITYSTTSNIVIEHPLDIDYDNAIKSACTLQACGATSSCTATETGLKKAIDLFIAQGRKNTNKVVVLLTDGKPNLLVNNPSTYMAQHPNSNYGSDSYENAAIMQAAVIQAKNWSFFPIETGLEGSTTNFMDRIYSAGKGYSTKTSVSPYTATGNPATYETMLRDLFKKIITSPKVRLVQ